MNQPIDHRDYIVTFDVAGYTDAVNALANKRGKEAHDKHWATICEFDELNREGGEMAQRHELTLENIITA